MTVRKIKTQTRDALSEYLSQFKFLQRSYSICPHLRTLPINMSGQRRVCSKLKPGLVSNSFYDKSAQRIKWHTAPGLYSACWKEVLKFKALILVSRKMQFGVKSVGNKQAELVEKLQNRQILNISRDPPLRADQSGTF